MHLTMFDVDGTLVQSYDFDTGCFVAAVEDVLGITVDTNWGKYRHVTDSGILTEIVEYHQLQNETDEIFAKVKDRFLFRISKLLRENKVTPIRGAADFLCRLSEMDEVIVTIATGGWREAAEMKLASGGIDTTAIPMASSSDHYDRTEIMKLAELRGGHREYRSRTYFGDGDWDRRASASLGYNFVLVGDLIEYHQSIPDFRSETEALGYIGL